MVCEKSAFCEMCGNYLGLFEAMTAHTIMTIPVKEWSKLQCWQCTQESLEFTFSLLPESEITRDRVQLIVDIVNRFQTSILAVTALREKQLQKEDDGE